MSAAIIPIAQMGNLRHREEPPCPAPIHLGERHRHALSTQRFCTPPPHHPPGQFSYLPLVFKTGFESSHLLT